MREHLPLALSLALLPGVAYANIDIVFDYTYANAFFGGAQKHLLDAAAEVFEARITDDLGAIASSGGNSLALTFFNPGNVTDTVTLNNATLAANEYRIYVGAANLGGGILGEGGPGGFSLFGDGAFFAGIGRGQAGYTPLDGDASNETDFAPWGGALAFNSASNWYFDSDPTSQEPFAGKADFYSVALHEIAHVLGFGAADTWHNHVDATRDTFNGPHAGTTALNATDDHWRTGLRSPIDGMGSFEAAMTPSLALGARKPFTDLDWNGLRDIGWQVSAVPEPATWAMLLAGLTGVRLAALARRRGQPLAT